MFSQAKCIQSCFLCLSKQPVSVYRRKRQFFCQFSVGVKIKIHVRLLYHYHNQYNDRDPQKRNRCEQHVIVRHL